MPQKGAFTILVEKCDQGQRLDVVVAARLADCSRSYAAHLITHHNIRVEGQHKKPGYRVRAGDEIQGNIPAPVPLDFKPEPIEIDILYEDKHLVVINKPAGLVVHPAPGHYSGTLVNALLYHCPDLQGIGGEIRPGIVHRLDKDTSGTLVAAKTVSAQEGLARQFKARTIAKKYLALVYGQMEKVTGVIRLPIGRHPIDRKKMSTTSRKSRTAETHWLIREKFKGFSLLELDLKTGRTHQIRVHCAAIKHPLVGDPVYGPRKLLKNPPQYPNGLSISAVSLIKSAKRQMLHAWQLGFAHPHTGERMVFESPLPADMREMLDQLRQVT